MTMNEQLDNHWKKRPFRHLVLFHNIISPALIARFVFFKLPWQAVYSLCPLLCFSKHKTLCMPQYFAQWYIPVSQNTLHRAISFSGGLTGMGELHHRRLVGTNFICIHKQYNAYCCAVNTWNACHECTRCHMHPHIQVRQWPSKPIRNIDRTVVKIVVYQYHGQHIVNMHFVLSFMPAPMTHIITLFVYSIVLLRVWYFHKTFIISLVQACLLQMEECVINSLSWVYHFHEQKTIWDCTKLWQTF